MSMLGDQRDLLFAFNAEDVEYMVVGGQLLFCPWKIYLANKQTTGRLRDLADVEHLTKMRNGR
jgi:hypothetical protein